MPVRPGTAHRDHPADWSGRRITLFLERCHWFTTVWVDGQQVGKGESLSVPHVFDLTDSLTPGDHRLTIRVDNRVLIDVGENSHSVTDHTQTNWNGIVGRLELRATPPVWIDDVQVFPDVAQQAARVHVTIRNRTGSPASVKLHAATSPVQASAAILPAQEVTVAGESAEADVQLSFGAEVRLWDEHKPHLYTLPVQLAGDADDRSADSVRHAARIHGRAAVHAERPADPVSRHAGVLHLPADGLSADGCGVVEDHHPPRQGIRTESHPVSFLVSAGSGFRRSRRTGLLLPDRMRLVGQWRGQRRATERRWTSGCIGKRTASCARTAIIRRSCLLAYGNEPAGPGPQQMGEEYLAKWVTHYKQHAPRQLVTCASGWPYLAESQYHVMHAPLRQHRQFDAQAPETTKDYRQHVARYPSR